jgi:hypothetical protein
MNCVLKHVAEENIEGMGSGGRRHKQLLGWPAVKGKIAVSGELAFEEAMDLGKTDYRTITDCFDVSGPCMGKYRCLF